MSTECTANQLEFHALGRRDVVGCFDGGRITSDGGGLLLREVDQRIGLLERMARCFTDYRNPNSIEHSAHSLVAQRVYGLALGYEDLNDHDVLRADSSLALLVGKPDLTGEHREREQDRGNPLAGSSTLNRLELSDPASAAGHRYKKVAADAAALDRLLVNVFVESSEKPPREIWLDLTPPTIHSMATRKAGSFTAITNATATCRSTFSVVSICCVPEYAPRIKTVPLVAWRNCNASWPRSANTGRRHGSSSAAIPVFAGTRSWPGAKTTK